MSDFKKGYYCGTISGCNVSLVGEKKTPCIKIIFDTDEGNVSWNGYLTKTFVESMNKSLIEVVVDTITRLGYKEKDIDMMADPNIDISSLFDTKKEFNLFIDYQKDKDGNQVEYKEVKFINFGNLNKNMESKNEVSKVLGGMNLTGELMRAKQEFGIKDVKNASTEVPF